MELICNVHGISDHSRRAVKNKKAGLAQERWICKKCDYLSSRKYYYNFKMKCINYGGGQCHKCGYNKCLGALHFHHLNPKNKEFGIFETRPGYKKSRTWDIVKIEIDKCILLCANCHIEEHEKYEKISLDKEKKFNLSRIDLYYINKSIIENKKSPEITLNAILTKINKDCDHDYERMATYCGSNNYYKKMKCRYCKDIKPIISMDDINDI